LRSTKPAEKEKKGGCAGKKGIILRKVTPGGLLKVAHRHGEKLALRGEKKRIQTRADCEGKHTPSRKKRDKNPSSDGKKGEQEGRGGTYVLLREGGKANLNKV